MKRWHEDRNVVGSISANTTRGINLPLTREMLINLRFRAYGRLYAIQKICSDVCGPGEVHAILPNKVVTMALTPRRKCYYCSHVTLKVIYFRILIFKAENAPVALNINIIILLAPRG